MLLFFISFLQDLDNEGNLPLEQVSIEEILEAQRAEQIQKQEEEKDKNKKMLERGLQPHGEVGHDEFSWIVLDGGVHVIPIWCAYDTRVVCMLHPCAVDMILGVVHLTPHDT